ncbi:MAG: UpxY family transcription antiterminator [Prevotella sp.]|nr:UpxY family transcription antiterminator [Prevotella sp.]
MFAKDEVCWFPMRVTYNREMSVKRELDALGIENFVPMHYELRENNGARKRVLVPAIHNLIFVRSTQDTLTELKNTRRELMPLRYIVRHTLEDGRVEIIVVPDRQMENFMRVAGVETDDVMFLDCNEYICRVGRRVRIVQGPFAGVEGVIKRIKNNKHVVVQVEGLAAVAITFVPPSLLEAVD